jgi:hypothetical protein
VGTIHLSINFFAQECPDCRVSFAMTTLMTNERREDYKSFYCPNGHAMSYKRGSSDLDKERQARQRAEQNVEYERQRVVREHAARLHQERRASTFKGHCTRIRKKVVQGKCPCGCDGTFANLRRHMAKHHPGWQPDAEPDSLSQPPKES